MSKYTRHHYIFAQLLSIFDKNIHHSCHLVDTYPEHPRADFECSMLNVYEKLYNLLTGSDDVTLLQEDYEVMLRVVKESQSLNKKGFQKIETVESAKTDEQPIVIAQTQIVHAPELTGNVDVYAMEDQLHLENMEETPVIKKKKKSKV